jgi:hypothetical protein
MEQAVRNKLRNVVTQCRKLLEDATAQALQGRFGIYAARKKGDVQIEDEARMAHLTDEDRACRRDLLDHLEHINATGCKPSEALDQLVREIAFTHLNRLCAYKMMEARGLIREAVSRGLKSQGFFFYLSDHPEDEKLHNSGRQDVAYRNYLDWLGGTLSQEIGVLFNPIDPANGLYPPQRVLDEVLALINDEELNDIWTQDETIGWVYQYFTPKELRDAIKRSTKVPRNSYEIAVRSSYYTPQFIVAFLADNTLGRIWYEMQQGETSLKKRCRYLIRRPTEIFLKEGEEPPEEEDKEARDDLSQKALLKQPVYIPHRPKKDPREIKVLDPACGSGHFLLYCFDLLQVIYEEAYNDPDLGATLRRDCLALEDLRRAVPGLILKHNLHGIDIDLRATQIAALALWLRCQRTYQELGLKNGERPKITRSNIVCAEPMSGEDDMRVEFVQSLDVNLGQLVNRVFNRMKLAGEAGSLLKIEEEITTAIREIYGEHGRMFRESDEQRWTNAEDDLLKGLREYTERAENGRGFRRRLFAEDAARGFAFIDLCRKRFDVVLMNPPYAETEGDLQAYLKHSYPANWTNLYSAFMERGMTVGGMRVGLVCPDGFLSAYRMRNLRSDFVIRRHLESLSCLGKDVFEEMGLSTVAVVLNSRMSTLHPVLVELSENGPGRMDYIHLAVMGERTDFILTPDLIHGGSSGWGEKPLFPTYGLVTSGNRTFDDFRFIRAWWEVSPAQLGERWQRWQKGGEYQPFFSSTPYVMDWDKKNDGASMRSFGISKVGTDAQVAQSSRYWWRSGLVGPAMNTTGAGFNIRILPEGQVFSAKSTVIIPKNKSQALVLLCLLNSRPLRWFLFQQGAGLAGNTGKIKRLPVVWPDAIMERRLESLAHAASNEMAKLESFKETSPCFQDCVRHPAVFVEEYQKCAAEIDELVSRLYQHNDADNEIKSTRQLAETAVIEATDGHILEPRGDSLVSYCFGVGFGRWDIRFATGEQQPPELPDPFDPLPICPPGMLQGSDGLPAKPEDIPPDYPVHIVWDGILADDPGHEDDIVRRVREVLEVIWKDRAEAIEKEACEILGVRELRDYFRKPGNGGFWMDHVKRYSKSRRKAPIYWYLRSAKGNYGLWLYYHRLDKDILFKALLNYVEPKIRLEEDRLKTLRGRKEAVGSSGREAKQIEKDMDRQEQFVSELRDFKDKLRRAANLRLDFELNDGVILNLAPLWELVPWSEPKKYWEELQEGKYDWSHIAYQLWPERVKDVCKRDRLIAIAHGLEHICKVEPPKSKRSASRDDADTEEEPDNES